MDRAVVAKFWYNHPFWERAVVMRQEQHTIQQILDEAKAQGHEDLSYQNVQKGLRNAAADLHLTAHASGFLRRRFEKISKEFNSYESMRDLALDGLRELSDLDEALCDPDLGTAGTIALTIRRDRIAERTFDWLTKCSDMGIKANLISADQNKPTGNVDADKVREEQEKLVEQFRARGSLIEAKSQYGPGNLRLPGEVEVEDGVDEKEDF